MELREATQQDINNFIMSDADAKEQVASCNEYIFENPDEYDVIVDDDKKEVYALGGVATNGIIWLLTSHLVEGLKLRGKLEFVRLIKDQVQHYKKISPTQPFLYNTVWSKNKQHIKFIKACGGIMQWNRAYKTPIGEVFVPFIIPNEYYNGGF